MLERNVVFFPRLGGLLVSESSAHENLERPRQEAFAQGVHVGQLVYAEVE